MYLVTIYSLFFPRLKDIMHPDKNVAMPIMMINVDTPLL